MSHRICLLLLGLLLSISSTTSAQEIIVESDRGGPAQNEKLESPEKRPILRYGRQRASKSWLEVGGSRVAIDDGIEWQGRRFYITLTYDLVATEIAPKKEGAPAEGEVIPAEKVLWKRDIGAFWNQIGIESFDRAPGIPVEALSLRSIGNAETVEFIDLKTGELIGGSNTDAAPGVPLALGGTWKGAEGNVDGARFEFLRSREEWTHVRTELFGDLESAPPADLGVDFAAYGIVVVYAGKTVNSNGFSGAAFENDGAVVLRLQQHSYQSMGETPPRWPWGVFAVPLRPGKDLVLERNTQSYIGGPALWKEWKRFAVK